MKLYWNELPFCQPVCDERTLMLANVNSQMRSEEKLNCFFQRLFPSVEVTRITNTYDVAKLADYQEQLKVAKEAIRYSRHFNEENRTELQVNPSCCCQLGESVNALDYYTKKKEKYRKRVQDETDKVLRTLENVVFVQFQNSPMAHR